jgi:hypothetical protein
VVTPDATAAELPRCPVPGHEESRVVLGGRYGKPGRRRQLYVCDIPKPGSSAASHRFTAPLAAPYANPTATPGGEGSKPEELRTARNYQFTAYEIASGLVAVGRGASYAKAGQDVREQAARRWGTPVREAAGHRHGTLVSDWVEVYAEALWETQAPHRGAWPERVFVGVLPLTAGRPGPPAPKLIFSVFVAMAYGADGRAAVFAIRASTGTGAAHWAAFLSELDRDRRGTPLQIVGDGSAGLARAVRSVWPGAAGTVRAAPALLTDEYLMRARARRICQNRGLDRRDGRLWLLLQRAWRSREDWERFTAEARRYRLPELDSWLARAEPAMSRQFAARAEGGHRTRQAVRAALRELSGRLGTRRTAFSNQARTDRLLRLMALDISGAARVHAWTDLICVWLEQSGGRPPASQRCISDRGRRRSLRGTPTSP